MNKINSLHILPTNFCALRCKHCGIKSGSDNDTFLDLKLLPPILEYAKNIGCQLVNISGGGEPFSIDLELKDIVKMISDQSMISRITTNGFWGYTMQNTLKRLEELNEVGLNQLFLSISEGHCEFVPIDYISNILLVSEKLGIQSCLYFLKLNDKQSIYSKVINQLSMESIPIPLSYEYPLIPVGRADENFSSNLYLLIDVNLLRGPCLSMGKNICIHPDGNVTACAMIIANECNPLIFGNIYINSFDDIILKINNSPLVKWISLYGVVALKETIEHNTKIHFRDNYVNICHLCSEIFQNEDALIFIEHKLHLYLKKNKNANSQL